MTFARYGFLVPAIALFVVGGFYLWKASRSGVFVGRDRMRAVVSGLCYIASALSFTAAFARASGSAMTDGSVAALLLLAGVVAAPSGAEPAKAASPDQ